MAGALKDTFPDFEHLHFGDNTEPEPSNKTPEREASIEDNNNQDEDNVPWSVFDQDLTKTQHLSNTDMVVKTRTCLRNITDDVKTGSMLYGSCDDYDSDEEKTQAEVKEETSEDEIEMHAGTSDLDGMIKEQAPIHVEDVSFLENVPGMIMEEKTSPLLMEDVHEEKSSASEEETTNSKDYEEYGFQHGPDKKEPNYLKRKSQSCPKSTDAKSRDDIWEFTEEDHISVEEGLADYPSDLYQSEDEDCSESHLGNPKLEKMHQRTDEEPGVYLMENQTMSFRNDHSKSENKSMNIEDVYEKDPNSYADKHKSEFTDRVVNAISENFQSIALMNENEECDHNGDTQGDGHILEKNTAISKQKNSLAEEYEEVIEYTDSQNEICDVGGLSRVPALPEVGMVDSMDGSSACELHSSANFNSSVSSFESDSVKQDQNNTDNNNDALNIENLNTLLPETFWSLIDKDSLKLDEYDWDINGEDVICDEEDDYMEELENEEEMERDWEKDNARIEAFNRYYKAFEGEENACRIHKVRFCLDPVSTQYEEECSSSEEELSTDINELNPIEHSSELHQSNNEPLEDLDDGEKVHHLCPEMLWSSTLLLDEENVEPHEYDHNIYGEDLTKVNSSKEYLEEQKNDEQEVKRDLKKEQTSEQEDFNRSNETHEDEDPDTSHRFLFNLDQEFSQTEDNESSEQESNTEEDTYNRKTEDPSESDEPQERRLYTGRQKVLQKPNKMLKEPKSKCPVLLMSVLAVSLATAVGLLSFWWDTYSLDWIY